MKPAAFGYERPSSLADALALLATRESLRPLAGGQSLVPMLNLRLSRPASLLDLALLGELEGASTVGSDLRIGALVTHAAIEDGLLPDVASGYLPHVAGGIAYRAIRNAGTVGGSLAHADPAADWPTALLALAGRVVLAGRDARRELTLEDFFVAPFITALDEGELLVEVRVPQRSEGACWVYRKLARKSGEFADSLVAIVLDREARYARAVLGGAAGTPRLLRRLSHDLLAEPFDPRAWTTRRCVDAIAADLDDVPDDVAVHAANLQRALRDLGR